MREKKLQLELIWSSGAFLLTETFLPNISHSNILLIANLQHYLHYKCNNLIHFYNTMLN